MFTPNVRLPTAVRLELAVRARLGEDPRVYWFVYLARCADDTFYCGITNDLVARLTAHNTGKGARYTRTRTPIDIVVTRRCASKSRALQLEYRVKQLTRVQKLALIAAPSLFTAMARKVTTRSRVADARRAG
jgi:putative endonuclease